MEVPIRDEIETSRTDEYKYLFDSFSLNDMHDFEDMLYDTTENIIDDNMLVMSNPNYRGILTEKILDTFFEDWLENELCTENDYHDIYEYVEEFLRNFLESIEDELPPRQSIYTHPEPITPEKREEISEKINRLRSVYQPPQRSDAWYEYRHNLMTASSMYKAMGTESQRNSLIYEKCKPYVPVKTNYFSQNSRQWGNTYEPISIMMYEHMYLTRVADFGCIQHPRYNCIGASPDGINIDPSSDRFGKMIEVKNIVNREITDTPKEEYWIQMQIQMETCDLNECDFIETRFKEYTSEEEFYADTREISRGVFLCFVEHIALESVPTNTLIVHKLPENTETSELSTSPPSSTFTASPSPKFIYMPLDLPCDAESVASWIHQQKMEMRSTHRLYSTTYWYLDEFSCILVKRNRWWFQAALPHILETWSVIEKERNTGYEHRAAKKRSQSMDNTLKFVKSECSVILEV